MKMQLIVRKQQVCDRPEGAMRHLRRVLRQGASLSRTPALLGAFSVLVGSAQAATWVMEPGTTVSGGSLFGHMNFDEVFLMEHVLHGDDPLIQTASGFEAHGDLLLQGESLAGNRGTVLASQKSHGYTDYYGDGRTAALDSLALLVLSGNLVVGDSMYVVGESATITEQSFRIVPEIGEQAGMPVVVNLEGFFQHLDPANSILGYNGSSVGLEQNGTSIYSRLSDQLPEGMLGFRFSTEAVIGDVFTLSLAGDLVATLDPGLATGVTGPDPAARGVFAALTISPVPEPASWAMLLTGMGLLCLRLRRRMSDSDQLVA